MRRGMRNPRRLKVIIYADRIIDINEYLVTFPGANKSEKKCDTELNDIFLKIMPNIWSRQAYVQDFDCESIT